MTAPPARLLIRGGIVFDPDGVGDIPAARDILIEGDSIVAVAAPGHALDGLETTEDIEIIEAADRMIVPGLVNAHYHSYDVLAKGLLEDMPFDVWALHSQPAYFGPRSRAELRMRVLLGAIECLRNGITTVQDMNTLVPQDEETLDVILSAYAEVGIRVVFSIALRDVGALDIAPFLPPGVPAEVMSRIEGADRDPLPDLAFVERQIDRRRDLPGRITWGLSPSGPQRSSRVLLEGIADIAVRRGLPVFTHVYETRAQTAKARAIYAAHGGSMIRWLDEVGLLLPQTTLAHCVWLKPEEMGVLAERGVSVAHNPISNMKLKSGVAPMRKLRCEGVNIALGCDNSSCGDCQNMFQAMKAFCLMAAVAEPQPTGILAADAVRAATLGGARAVGLAGVVGALRPGMKADLVIIDLSDPAYMPFNNATRQLVFSESGRGVETSIVDGRVVMRNRRMTTVDEAEIRTELAGVMPGFRTDFATVAAANARAAPYLLRANGNIATFDVGVERFLEGATK
jgi:cytosine/adenosine deaminase-related metal-dependent hydrolase